MSMTLLGFKLGQGGIILRVKLRNVGSSVAAGITGLNSDSAGLRISTLADNESSVTQYLQSSGNIETIATLGTYAAPTSGKCRFREVHFQACPGVYEIQLPDARFAVPGAKYLQVSVNSAPNLAEADVIIPLTQDDPYAATSRPLAATGLNAVGAETGLSLPGAVSLLLAIFMGRRAAPDAEGNVAFGNYLNTVDRVIGNVDETGLRTVSQVTPFENS